jgi:cholesterol transport system auxiliary component
VKLALVLLAGCALTQKAAPLELRYFAPPTRATAERARVAPSTPLRLGHVTTSALLGTRIVHRDSAVESAPYETLRWTDEPDVYVRRSLARALFDAAPFEQAIDSEAPTLDVDVLAFEEVRRGASRLGRVELRYEVRDDKRVVAHGTIAIERAAGAGIEGVVAAIGRALDDATSGLASRVADEVPPVREAVRGAPRTGSDGPLQPR